MSIIQRVSAPRPVRPALHPPTILALLLASAVLGGCARRYDMTLTNGGHEINVRKATYHKEGGYWTFVTANGKKNTVAASHVVNVVPHGDTNGMFSSQ